MKQKKYDKESNVSLGQIPNSKNVKDLKHRGCFHRKQLRRVDEINASFFTHSFIVIILFDIPIGFS